MKIISIHKNDTDLIARAKRKDRSAQKEIYQKFAPKMLSVTRQYIKDLQYAEDAMMKGFLIVFTQIEKFENKGSFEGWIRRIMVNSSLAHLRKKNILNFVEEYTVEPSKNSNNQEEYIEEGALQFLVDQLPNDQKVVFVLYVVEGYKHKEISKTLNISENASKIRLVKARKMLQNLYSQQHNQENG